MSSSITTAVATALTIAGLITGPASEAAAQGIWTQGPRPWGSSGASIP